MPGTTQDPHYEKRWLILFVIAVAQLMVVLDATIVNVALPSVQRDLGFSDDARQWIITAYALSFGSLLLLGGRLGDLFGRKWAFIGGLIGFAVASAVGGAADSFGMLVAARAAQGVFGAILAPSALGLLSQTFTDPAERGKAFAAFGAVAGGGAAMGLLLGGILTEAISWRWCLYVNLAFALPAAFMGFRLLVQKDTTHRPQLDLPGVALATSGLFALVYGFSNSEMHSWTHVVTIVALGAAVVLLSTFAWYEKTQTDHPLLPLRVILDRTRGGAYLAIGLAGIAMFANFLFLTYYMQQNLGFSPIQTGLAFLPMPLTIITTSAIVNIKLLNKVGPRPLLVFGMTLGTLVMVWFAQLQTDSTYAGHILPGLVVLGVGMANIFAPAFATATHGVEPQDTGVASAMVNTMQQVGGSIGTALLSSIFASSAAGFAESNGPGPAAAVHGYTTAFWVAAAVFGAGALIVGSVMRTVKVREAQGEPVAAH